MTLTNGATTLGTVAFRPDGTATFRGRRRWQASRTWWRRTPATSDSSRLVVSRAGDGREDGGEACLLRFADSGRPGVVKVSVRTVAGLPATGKIRLKVGSSTVTVKLRKGVAKLRIPQVPSTATVKVKVSYSGDGQYAGASVKHTFQLRR